MAQSFRRAVFLQEQEAIGRPSAELKDMFFKAFGKEPHPDVIREEAEGLVLKYGVKAEIRDIFSA